MQDIVPADVMIPPGRLLSLIEQALEAQGSAVACYDNRIQRNTSLFFDATSSIQCLPIACTQVLQEHRDQVLSVAFSPDGAWLASCSQDGRVGFWQV
jgi:WD repeat-containing protein 26